MHIEIWCRHQGELMAILTLIFYNEVKDEYGINGDESVAPPARIERSSFFTICQE
jgi:hypothetical protein